MQTFAFVIQKYLIFIRNEIIFVTDCSLLIDNFSVAADLVFVFFWIYNFLWFIKFKEWWTHSCGFERKSFRINTAAGIIFSWWRGCNSSLKKLKLFRFCKFWPWVVDDRVGITSWLPNYVAWTIHARRIPFFQKCCLQNQLHRSTCSSDTPNLTRIRIIQLITKVFNHILTYGITFRD